MVSHTAMAPARNSSADEDAFETMRDLKAKVHLLMITAVYADVIRDSMAGYLPSVGMPKGFRTMRNWLLPWTDQYWVGTRDEAALMVLAQPREQGRHGIYDLQILEHAIFVLSDPDRVLVWVQAGTRTGGL